MMDYIFNLDQYLIEMIPIWGNYIYLMIAAVIFLESACILTPFLPGDGLLFVLGLFSAQHFLNVEVTLPLVFIATLSGYAINYWLGKKIGLKLMPWMKRRGFEKSLQDSESYYQRYGVKALVMARFIPVVRTFLPLVMGLLNLSVVKFWIANLVGATLWVSILIGSGWFFGKLGMVSSNISFVIYGIMFLSILPIIYESMKFRWKKNV
ncbi:MAG: VTT domain-containing protein [Pseudomonadota bacterium]|nr:VTT domain-containing protein [Pseudomonadota bacterium]